MSSTDKKSIPNLFGGVVEQLGHLIGTEVRLARAELSEKIEEVGAGMAFVGAAAVLMSPAVVMVLIALALWLAQIGIAAPVAYLLSGIIGGVLAGILLVSGLNRLKLNRLTLKRTAEQINQDFAAARNLAK